MSTPVEDILRRRFVELAKWAEETAKALESASSSDADSGSADAKTETGEPLSGSSPVAVDGDEPRVGIHFVGASGGWGTETGIRSLGRVTAKRYDRLVVLAGWNDGTKENVAVDDWTVFEGLPVSVVEKVESAPIRTAPPPDGMVQKVAAMVLRFTTDFSDSVRLRIPEGTYGWEIAVWHVTGDVDVEIGVVEGSAPAEIDGAVGEPVAALVHRSAGPAVRIVADGWIERWRGGAGTVSVGIALDGTYPENGWPNPTVEGPYVGGTAVAVVRTGGRVDKVVVGDAVSSPLPKRNPATDDPDAGDVTWAWGFHRWGALLPRWGEFQEWIGRDIEITQIWSGKSWKQISRSPLAYSSWKHNAGKKCVIYVPMLPHNGEGGSYRDFDGLVRGKYDEWWRQFALNTMKAGIPDAWVRLSAEFNSSRGRKDGRFVYGGQSDNAWYDPDGFVRAWRHVVGVMRSENPRIRVEWAPILPSTVDEAKELWRSLWPGEEWCDAMGFSYYDVRARTTDVEIWQRAYGVVLDWFVVRARDYGLKVNFGEWGLWPRHASVVDGGDHPVFVRETWRWLKRNEDVVGYEIYFNSEGTGGILFPPEKCRVPKSAEEYRRLWRRYGE